MSQSRIHLHSMLVHSVVALAVVAAVSFALLRAGAAFGRLGPELWQLLLVGSLVALLLLSVPAVVTGIADRDHAYANWHPSHRAKLALSLLLVAVVAFELVAMLLGSDRAPGWLGAGITANVVLVVALAAYGLRITLGRQALARTSYVPDMKQDPPVDILEAVAAAAADSARLIDPSEEDAA